MPNLLHLGGDHAQVLGYDRQVPEFCLHSGEQVSSWSFYPAAVRGSLVSCGNFPVGFEAAEVIDAYNVVEPQGCLKTIDPPFVAGGSELFPVVDGISPQLTRGAEIIWGHARHLGRIPSRIQRKKFAICPDIGAVMSNVNRNVADDRHAMSVRVSAQCLPLAEEFKLPKFDDLELICQPGSPLVYGPRFALGNFGRPACPGDTPMCLLTRHEKREVI